MDVKELSKLDILFHSVIRLHHKRAYMLLDNLGLHPNQPMTLFFIYKNNGLSQRELAEELKIKPASITVMLQRMEKAELVTRCMDENDQRITRVYITDKGKENLNIGLKTMKTLSEECFGDLSADDKEKLSELLSIIIRSLNKSCGEEINLEEKIYKGDDVNA